MNPRQLLRRLFHGDFENVAFTDAQHLVEALGYRLDRVRGSHYLYEHPAVPLALNLQARGREAKAYQLRELLQYVERYELSLEDEP